jgi:hypothetical protein
MIIFINLNQQKKQQLTYILNQSKIINICRVIRKYSNLVLENKIYTNIYVHIHKVLL